MKKAGVKKADNLKVIATLLILQFVFQVLIKIFKVMVKLQIADSDAPQLIFISLF